MSVMKNSKQRDAILANLQSRYDHPSAEEIFLDVKKLIPSLSLATVYRNLRLLESEGLILKIRMADSDRFDGHTHDHNHFTCQKCSGVLDLELNEDVNINSLPKNFDGLVRGHHLMFYGVCPNCNK